MKIKYALIILICFCTFQLNAQVQESKFDDHFLNQAFSDSSNFYHIDCSKYPSNRNSLPIGVFDSGTGGLTVLHALIDYDQNDNVTKSIVPKGDGVADFKNEQFIYFGDQANMPYGNYAKENKTDFLKQLIYKDALFLMGTKYFQSAGDSVCKRNKQPVKLIVIACNTATAYGKSDIEAMIEKSGCKIKVIGVIDAGTRGALENFSKNESGTIAVMATAGTVQSNGYLNAFRNLKEKNGYTGNIDFIQQGGSGIAEAIDEEPNYIDRKSQKPRSIYKGPELNNNDLKIEKKLIQIYQFDTINNALLCDSNIGDCSIMQLNSPENYMRYHLVSLCEQLRIKNVQNPLKVLILGCTHYPYLTGLIQKFLKELFDFKMDGKYIYRKYLSSQVILVDPAINTAKEVYAFLKSNQRFNSSGSLSKSEFYISTPDILNRQIEADSLGQFTYGYKYGRSTNVGKNDTKPVPMSRSTLPYEIIKRFQSQIPSVFQLMQQFNSQNKKTTFLSEKDRL